VPVRKYEKFSKDDANDLRKVRSVLNTLLNAHDLSELEQRLVR